MNTKQTRQRNLSTFNFKRKVTRLKKDCAWIRSSVSDHLWDGVKHFRTIWKWTGQVNWRMDQAKHRLEENIANEAISIGTGSWPPSYPSPWLMPLPIAIPDGPFAVSGAHNSQWFNHWNGQTLFASANIHEPFRGATFRAGSRNHDSVTSSFWQFNALSNEVPAHDFFWRGWIPDDKGRD